ncbi:MAG: hypothetical protein HWE24_06335 [Oceanospirillaceae bacterium]|nr:hypothetical protein [Oceanospirillaceae bacterium]
MRGKNWNSKTGEYSELVKSETLKKAKKAQELRSNGQSVADIAKILGLSTGRIYEYLRD